VTVTYYFSKTLDAGFDDAVARTTEALKRQGFGIITEIDVKETLSKKLGVDFRNYKILGACNPALAYEALKAEDKVGHYAPLQRGGAGNGRRQGRGGRDRSCGLHGGDRQSEPRAAREHGEGEAEECGERPVEQTGPAHDFASPAPDAYRRWRSKHRTWYFLLLCHGSGELCFYLSRRIAVGE
jgi:hypothetical protein